MWSFVLSNFFFANLGYLLNISMSDFRSAMSDQKPLGPNIHSIASHFLTFLSLVARRISLIGIS